MSDYVPIVFGVLVELFIALFAFVMLNNYRQHNIIAQTQPRRSIIAGYRFVIGLSIAQALLMLAMPILLDKL